MATVITRYVNPDSTAGGDGTTSAITGANRAYISLTAWEAARQADIVTADTIERVVCAKNSTNDTARLVVDGWTTDATRYCFIEADKKHRAGSAWDDSKYILSYNTVAQVVISSTEAIKISGLQVHQLSHTDSAYGTDFGTTCGLIELDGLFLRGAPGPNWANHGLVTRADATVWNCIVCDFQRRVTGGNGAGWNRTNASTGFGYNNLMYNCDIGYSHADDGGSMTLINCVSAVTDGDGFDEGWQWQDCDYNASDQAADAPGPNSRNSQTFNFVDPDNYDFTLLPYDLGAKDRGAPDPADGLFNTDINGNVRSAPWNMGPMEAPVAADINPTRPMVLEKPWTKQPPANAEIDWSHPIAQKLEFLWIGPHTGGAWGRDLVSGAFGTLGATGDTPTVETTWRGRAVNQIEDGASVQYIDFATNFPGTYDSAFFILRNTQASQQYRTTFTVGNGTTAAIAYEPVVTASGRYDLWLEDSSAKNFTGLGILVADTDNFYSYYSEWVRDGTANGIFTSRNGEPLVESDGATTATSTTHTSDMTQVAIGTSADYPAEGAGAEILFVAVFREVLLQEQITSLHNNPWQVLKGQKVFVPPKPNRKVVTF